MTAPGRLQTADDPRGKARTHDHLTAFRKAQQRVQQMNADAKRPAPEDQPEEGQQWAQLW